MPRHGRSPAPSGPCRRPRQICPVFPRRATPPRSSSSWALASTWSSTGGRHTVVRHRRSSTALTTGHGSCASGPSRPNESRRSWRGPGSCWRRPRADALSGLMRCARRRRARRRYPVGLRAAGSAGWAAATSAGRAAATSAEWDAAGSTEWDARCVRHLLTDDLPWLVFPAGFCHPSTWWTFDDALGMFGAMARSRHRYPRSVTTLTRALGRRTGGLPPANAAEGPPRAQMTTPGARRDGNAPPCSEAAPFVGRYRSCASTRGYRRIDTRVPAPRHRRLGLGTSEDPSGRKESATP